MKTAIQSYIDKTCIRVFDDKYMDFFSAEDLYRVVKLYIDEIYPSQSLFTEMNLVYGEKYKITDICQIINNLSDYSVPVITTKDVGHNYTGCGDRLVYLSRKVQLLGMRESIRQMYNELINPLASSIIEESKINL